MEIYLKEKRLQESWSPQTTATPTMNFQTLDFPVLDKDKEENPKVSEPIIDKPEDSEDSSQSEVKENGMSAIENEEAFHSDIKQACEEGVKRAMEQLQKDKGIEKRVKMAMEQRQNDNSIEEKLNDEDNDSIEDAKKWALQQKQSLTNY